MIQLLKLGGSLITDKSLPRAPRNDVLKRISDEVAAYRTDHPESQLILGHGSGSFGHIPAKKYATRNGVRSAEEWRGFAEVHCEATALNRLVVDALRNAGLPVLPFSALEGVRCAERKISAWDRAPIFAAIENGLIPVVFGDTIFDSVLGGTILSTEELFAGIIRQSSETLRVLLAGIEAGIYADFPARTELVPEIRLDRERKNGLQFIQGSVYPDVTGGMKSKIEAVGTFLENPNVTEALVFSGNKSGSIYDALSGTRFGTRVVRP